MFIRFTVRVFSKRLSICVGSSFPFGFEGGMCDMIVLGPEHCLSIYFTSCRKKDLLIVTSWRNSFIMSLT